MSVDNLETTYPIGRVIVLAAGKPHEGNSPTPVQRFDGQTRALDWTISSLVPLCATPPVVVIGFGADEVVAEYQIVSNLLSTQLGRTPIPQSLCFSRL